MKILKSFAKSKTMWFALLLTIFGSVESYFGLLKEVLSPAAYGFGMIVIGVIVAALRFITTQPIGKK